MSENIILEILEDKELDFEKAYYSAPCSECFNGEKEKAYPFLEYHFYLYTKDNKFVSSSFDTIQGKSSYNRLESIGKVDNSYIASIIVCRECGKYTIEIEQLEV